MNIVNRGWKCAVAWAVDRRHYIVFRLYKARHLPQSLYYLASHFLCHSVRDGAERRQLSRISADLLILRSSGSSPAWGGDLFNRKRSFLAHSLSLSSAHLIWLKNCWKGHKIARHPSELQAPHLDAAMERWWKVCRKTVHSFAKTYIL